MSRIYKKTNFAGSDSSTGIAFGGGGGGGGGGRTRGSNGSPNVYSNNKSTIDVARDKERGSGNSDRDNQCVPEHTLSVSTGPGYGVHVKKGKYEASAGAAAKVGVEAKYNAKNGLSAEEFAKVEIEGKVKSPKGELSAGKVGLEVKHDGEVKTINDGASVKIGNDKGSINSRDEIEIGGHAGIIGVNYKYSCR